MLSSICRMALKPLQIAFFGMKTSRYCLFYATLKCTPLHNVTKVVNRFMHHAFYHSQDKVQNCLDVIFFFNFLCVCTL